MQDSRLALEPDARGRSAAPLAKDGDKPGKDAGRGLLGAAEQAPREGCKRAGHDGRAE
ncbi:hypothetical protein [Nitrosococcus watsonii]|uniref:hypothetical protein n=1 Tax=Nitrosococcus watsonii TaxID=473531 RepID=UPI0012F961AB|nr:hypothetical protein [Nitrosococcus watsonii]